MSLPNERPARVVVIPWIIALIAFLGWNALAPDQFRSKKVEDPARVRLSQSTDDDQALRGPLDPLGPIALVSSGRVVLPGLFSVPHGVEVVDDRPVASSRGLLAQGRAPPL